MWGGNCEQSRGSGWSWFLLRHWPPGVAWGPQDLGVQLGWGQVQAALRRPWQPAPTTVALGWVPMSGLKSAPPAQACPGPWQPGAGINTGELE